MKNGMAIGALARQLKAAGERIGELTMDIEQFEQGSEEMVSTCVDLRMDELEHAQMLVLKLTEFITQAAEGEPLTNTDEGGSVFAPGDLNDDAADNGDCIDPVASE